MRLSEFLRPELIKVRLEAKDKWDAIEELIDLAVAAGELEQENRKKVLDIVFDRERSMSTGMERGIAIPHASTHLVNNIVGAIGISKTGIPFESLDGQPAKIIVLLIIPKDKFQQHVRTLAGIARLLNHELMAQALRNAKTSEDAMDIIRAEERRDLFTT
jgi:mannitol/fructose-specific phosphotransferase system IIA component (Ntr-type)